MRPVTVSLVLIFAVSMPSTGADLFGKKPKKKYDCETQVTKAIDRYNKKQFADVKILLDDVKLQCAGHSVIDTVFYYSGMALLRQKLPIDAKVEFERLMQDYPNSAFSQEAHYRVGQCSYLESNPFDRDQAKTRDAIRDFQEFLDQFGAGPLADSARAYLDKCNDKLAHKEYATARFYDKQGQYEAAIVYYRIVDADYPASAYAPESMLGMARALKKTNRIAEAQTVLNEIIAGSYGGPVKQRAESMLQRLNDKTRD